MGKTNSGWLVVAMQYLHDATRGKNLKYSTLARRSGVPAQLLAEADWTRMVALDALGRLG